MLGEAGVGGALMTCITVPVLLRLGVNHIIDGINPRTDISYECWDDYGMAAARQGYQVLRQLPSRRICKDTECPLKGHAAASAQNSAHPFGRLCAPWRGTKARVCEHTVTIGGFKVHDLHCIVDRWSAPRMTAADLRRSTDCLGCAR